MLRSQAAFAQLEASPMDALGIRGPSHVVQDDCKAAFGGWSNPGDGSKAETLCESNAYWKIPPQQGHL